MISNLKRSMGASFSLSPDLEDEGNKQPGRNYVRNQFGPDTGEAKSVKANLNFGAPLPPETRITLAIPPLPARVTAHGDARIFDDCAGEVPHILIMMQMSCPCVSAGEQKLFCGAT